MADDEAPTAPNDDLLAFAHRMFDLAREGATEELAAYIDAGLSVDLTNHAGDTLLILAAYHDRPATVRALLERSADHARINDRGQTALAGAAFRGSLALEELLAAGADPALGSPSAHEVARFFNLPEVARRLEGRPA